jgi:hypothetical protein
MPKPASLPKSIEPTRPPPLGITEAGFVLYKVLPETLIGYEEDIAVLAYEALIEEVTCGKVFARFFKVIFEVVELATDGNTSELDKEVTEGNSLIFIFAILYYNIIVIFTN